MQPDGQPDGLQSLQPDELQPDGLQPTAHLVVVHLVACNQMGCGQVWGSQQRTVALTMKDKVFGFTRAQRHH